MGSHGRVKFNKWTPSASFVRLNVGRHVGLNIGPFDQSSTN